MVRALVVESENDADFPTEQLFVAHFDLAEEGGTEGTGVFTAVKLNGGLKCSCITVSGL